MEINPSYINPKYNLDLEKPENTLLVSYSQFSKFTNCPLSWKLGYIDKLRSKESSIHTIFGNAMHNTIQHWIQIMYNTTIKASNELNLKSILFDQIKSEYLIGLKNGELPLSKEELTEFYIDGCATLEWLKKRRNRYFTPRHEILIGTEVPIVIMHNGVSMLAYLDMVRLDKRDNIVTITDFKTSGFGWKDREKTDKVKTSQLILYKIFFAEQYNVPIENIRIEYLILKRKVQGESEWPQKRIQMFSPASGKVSINWVKRQFELFLSTCFLPDGSYNTLYNYPAICGEKEKNCKFCEFRDDPQLCPPMNRKVQ